MRDDAHHRQSRADVSQRLSDARRGDDDRRELIRASFVPPGPIQELRDLTRTRKQLVREVVQHKERIQKVLEDANLKLDSVVSDLLGASGWRMLRAMIAGEQNPDKLAALAGERLTASP